MNFPYMFIEQSQDSIDIEDMGNVCINTLNDDLDEWYLQISTECGFCTIKQFGPLKVDDNKVPSGFYLSYFKMEYNEKKLWKTINDFLNNNKRDVTQVFLIDEATARNRLRDVLTSV